MEYGIIIRGLKSQTREFRRKRKTLKVLDWEVINVTLERDDHVETRASMELNHNVPLTNKKRN